MADDNEILARIDERTKRLQTDVSDMKTQLSGGYVTMERFRMVERLVYGQAALVLIAAAGAILKMIIK